jgi:hypothetical protein
MGGRRSRSGRKARTRRPSTRASHMIPPNSFGKTPRATFRLASLLSYRPHVRKYVTRAAIKNHNTLRKHDSIHRDRDIYWALLGLVSGLEIIVFLDSEDDAPELRRRRACVTNFGTRSASALQVAASLLVALSQRLLSLVCDYFLAISDTVKAFLHTYLVVFEASLPSTPKDQPRTIMNHQT